MSNSLSRTNTPENSLYILSLLSTQYDSMLKEHTADILIDDITWMITASARLPQLLENIADHNSSKDLLAKWHQRLMQLAKVLQQRHIDADSAFNFACTVVGSLLHMASAKASA